FTEDVLLNRSFASNVEHAFNHIPFSPLIRVLHINPQAYFITYERRNGFSVNLNFTCLISHGFPKLGYFLVGTVYKNQVVKNLTTLMRTFSNFKRQLVPLITRAKGCCFDII